MYAIRIYYVLATVLEGGGGVRGEGPGIRAVLGNHGQEVLEGLLHAGEVGSLEGGNEFVVLDPDLLGLGGGEPLEEREGGFRITSYNVCYTKLLRRKGRSTCRSRPWWTR